MAAVKPGSIFVLFGVMFLSFGLEILADNELFFTHAPSYVHLSPEGGNVLSSEVPDIISLALGFTATKDVKWSGLSSGSLFRRPKANVLIAVEGFDGNLRLKLDDVIASYPITKDVPLINTESVSNHLERLFQDRYPIVVDVTADGKLFNLDSKQSHLFAELPKTLKQMQPLLQNSQSSVLFSYEMGSLNYSKEPDFIFLSELQLLQEIADAVNANDYLAKDNVPDMYSFSLVGIHLLRMKYGQDSMQVTDGLKVLSSFINKFNERLISLYNGDVMIEVITLTLSEPRMVRQKRQTDETDDSQPTEEDWNIAPSYDEDYASMLHISIWISVAWILAIFVISYLMWNIDPGDSIIYRMTNTRMKTE